MTADPASSANGPLQPAAGADDPGLVAVVAYDGLCTFEFGIALEIFALPRPEFAFPWYTCRVVAGEECGPAGFRATGGVSVRVDGPLGDLDRARTIILPGWRDRFERPPEPLLAALRRAADRGARLLSICSGVFLLAAAGVLTGKRATTHWRYLDDLRRGFTGIEVVDDVLYVDNGTILTSAGSAAGIDACLHLVRRDFGGRIANQVARRLVSAPHRQGGQAQFVEAPVQHRPGRSLAAVMDWARARLDQPLTIGDFARAAALSDRSLLRHFRAATGLTPKAWLQAERMARAKDLLEATRLSLDEIAAQCGYDSTDSFRIAFRRLVGLAPGTYRSRFRRDALQDS